MSVASAIPLVSATIHLCLSALLAAISRAPGWQTVRVFAVIAFTAGAYSGSQILMTLDGLPPALYASAGRFTYAMASVHAAAWLVFSFGTFEAPISSMPRWAYRLAVALASAGIVGAFLPSLLGPPSLIEVGWAGVRYHYPAATPLSDALGYAVVASLILACAQFARRVLSGERRFRWVVPGMVVFLACAVDEVLVANRLVQFISLADLGFVALVLPVSVEVVRRFVADARRLEALTQRLEEEVRTRTERLDRAKEALTQAERLASLGRMAAGVGHEINNPVAWMRVALDDVEGYLAASAAPPDAREALGELREGLARIQGVAERLRSQARREGGLREVVDLCEVARKALDLSSALPCGSWRIQTALSPVPRLGGDLQRLARAVANLISNAAAAAADRGGPRTVTVRTRSLPGGEACIEVEDDGPGIPPEILARVGEPYFTTRAHQGALGLGLFVARGIAEAHRGRLEVVSRPGGGTCARLAFPPAALSARFF